VNYSDPAASGAILLSATKIAVFSAFDGHLELCEMTGGRIRQANTTQS
jgi:hypothetical protein